jgi:hypothetical protein
MAIRYWVTGGTGNWDSTSNWSTSSGGLVTASVPSTFDDVIFNAASCSGTANVNISPTVKTLTMTGFTGTLAFGTNTISLNHFGASSIFTGSTTCTVTGTPQIICTDTSVNARQIEPGLVTEANSISFRITGGSGTFGIVLGSVRNLDFTDGTNPTGFTGTLTNTSRGYRRINICCHIRHKNNQHRWCNF